MRPLLFITFHQEFRISNNIGHPTSGSGGKKTVKWYLKSEQTDRQTHIWTFRLIKIIGQRADALQIQADKQTKEFSLF